MLTGSAYIIARVGETEEMVMCHFQKGEMISVPAGVWHRLGPGPGTAGYMSLRFYHNKRTWTKQFRGTESGATRHQSDNLDCR